MTNPFPMPSKEQQDRCERVQAALIAELNLAEREGAQPAELLTALAAAAAVRPPEWPHTCCRSLTEAT